MKVDGHSEEHATALGEALSALDEVVACHIVSGPADFLVEIVAVDLEHYEHLLLGTLLKLPGVADVRSNIAIRTIKANGALPLAHLATRRDA